MTLVTQIKTIIDEPNASKFWPIAQVYDAANEASIEVLGSGQYDLMTATITATASQVFVTVPSTLMIPKFVLTTSNDALPKTTEAALEREGPNWGTATNTAPIAFLEVDQTTIQIYPIVTTSVEYRFVGVPYPTEITTGVEDFTSNEQYSFAAKFWAASSLMDATRPDLSDVFRSEGDEVYVMALRQWRNQQSHLLRTLRPAGAADARRFGDMSVIRLTGGFYNG